MLERFNVTGLDIILHLLIFVAVRHVHQSAAIAVMLMPDPVEIYSTVKLNILRISTTEGSLQQNSIPECSQLSREESKPTTCKLHHNSGNHGLTYFTNVSAGTGSKLCKSGDFSRDLPNVPAVSLIMSQSMGVWLKVIACRSHQAPTHVSLSSGMRCKVSIR